MKTTEWIKKEFSKADLGDERLNRRLSQVANTLTSQPGLSVNKACDDWGATKAAYRLFNNEKVTPENILSSHIDNTIERSLKFPFIRVPFTNQRDLTKISL